MAYFANGTEWMNYEEKYCFNCVHNDEEGEMCAVAVAHFDFAYDLCNDHEHPGKIILDMLIPEGKDGFPEKCRMFHDMA